MSIFNKVIILILFTSNLCHAITKVGEAGDPNCDFTDLQMALDTGDSEFHLSKDSIFIGPYTLPSNTKIIGGYDDCSSDANNSIESNTQIIAPATGSILYIEEGDALSQIDISNLDIKNAVNGSGINISGFSGAISLINSIIHNNNNSIGAGIYIKGDMLEEKPTLIIINSQIIQNLADSQGGGIYCKKAKVIIDSSSLIASNEVFGNNVNGSGGGIYSTQCEMDIYAGHIDGVSAGIIANKSTNSGAGIYASQSQINLNGQQENTDNPVYGNNSQPVLLKGNISDSDQSSSGYGGAMYLSLSEVLIKGVWFDNNKGSESGVGDHNRGSVFHANYQSIVTITRDEDQPCWREGLCNLISNNLHVAIYAQRPGTVVSIFDTEFYNNSADYTGIIWARNGCCLDSGFGPTLNFENNLVHHNNSINAGFIKTDSDTTNHCCELAVNILNNTIADNNFSDSDAVIDINSDVTLNMHNNIIYENSPISILDSLEVSNPIEINISCLLAHEIDSVPNLDTTIFVDNPLFVNPSLHNYHLTENSPAIDICGKNEYVPLRLDIDQQYQNNDNPDIKNLEGIYDLGVDEYYMPDLIFENNFEI